jgi:hypothetical protein
MNELTSGNPAVTMTSLELVDFINIERRAQADADGAVFPSKGFAKLEHADFMKKVPEVLGICAGNFSGTYEVPGPNGGVRLLPCYRFPKREACLMAMSYSYELQAKVFDRMTALESAISGGMPMIDQIDQTMTAAKLIPALVRVARLFGCDKNAAAISANQAAQKLTGTNMMQLLGHTHLEAANQDDLFFTPTELGKRLGGTSARGMNLLLAEAGLQMKRNDVWEVTEAGKDFARIYDTGKKHGSGVPIQQIKWSANVLRMLGADKEAA